MNNKTPCSNNIRHLTINVANSVVCHEKWDSRKAEWNNQVVYKVTVTNQIAGSISF